MMSAMAKAQTAARVAARLAAMGNIMAARGSAMPPSRFSATSWNPAASTAPAAPASASSVAAAASVPTQLTSSKPKGRRHDGVPNDSDSDAVDWAPRLKRPR